jgi:uncharacterized membrane protein
VPYERARRIIEEKKKEKVKNKEKKSVRMMGETIRIGRRKEVVDNM